MSNADLLVTVNKQAGTAAQECAALQAAVVQHGQVLKHEAVPVLDQIVIRLTQAHSAALELQQRAHGGQTPPRG